MTVVRAVVKRVGGSILLALPPRDARALHLKEGQAIQVYIPPKDIEGFGAYQDLDLTSDVRSERRTNDD